MPSVTTTHSSTTATVPASLEQLSTATVALFVAIKCALAGSPAATPYRAALRRKGRDLAEAGGPSALVDVLARVRKADETRKAVIDEVWAGLPGWRS